MPTAGPTEAQNSTPEPVNEPPLPITPALQTIVNSYGIYRVYPGGMPSFTPDEIFNIASVTDSPNFTQKTYITCGPIPSL